MFIHTGMAIVLQDSLLHDLVPKGEVERRVVGADETVAVDVDGRLGAASTVRVFCCPVGFWKDQGC